MQFGIGVSAHIKNWEFIQYAESLGFDRAWVGDSQMIWSDCYAVLALAAHHTIDCQHRRNCAGADLPGLGHWPHRDARDGP
jgi:hypothetical protein